jgi:putative inorganic carbon (HCO3(-)) transporter
MRETLLSVSTVMVDVSWNVGSLRGCKDIATGRYNRRMARFVPALLLLLFGAWCGTFAWGATFPGWAAAVAALLGTVLWLGPGWRDPLRLGSVGRWLPLALWFAVVASAWASPVPRAGKVGVLLLPAFLWLPGAVERCWRRETDGRWGLRSVAAVVAAISLWALIDQAARSAPRAAMPLGHHNLLAGWLVMLLPVAVLPARERGPWKALGIAGGLVPVAAILASRSLAGALALAVEVGAAVGWWLWHDRGARRSRRTIAVLLILLGFAGGAFQIPRLRRILAGEDVSVRARTVYYEAGREGFLARPLLGWGPGSVAWTAAAFLDPVPGVSPWGGESVGELHSLPLQLAYELGASGLLLALAVAGLFVGRRFSERRQARDPALAAAGLLGLLGGAVTSLGSGALAVTALPLSAAVAAGAALSGTAEEEASMTPPSRSGLPVRVYVLAAGIALLPPALAVLHYDRAVAAGTADRPREAQMELARAVRLDPSFPLYRMRLALLQSGSPGERAGSVAELALQAAEDGRAVAPLWLVAGALGFRAHAPWTKEAVATACALEPLDGFPPFYVMLADPGAEDAAVHGAHALLAEPLLAAALFWERHPDLLVRTLVEVRRWPGVDPGWREALVDAASSTPAQRLNQVDRLLLAIDTDLSQSLSLHSFRRRPWPVLWPLVTIRKAALERLVPIPPATALRTTSARAVDRRLCGASGPLLPN